MGACDAFDFLLRCFAIFAELFSISTRFPLSSQICEIPHSSSIQVSSILFVRFDIFYNFLHFINWFWSILKQFFFCSFCWWRFCLRFFIFPFAWQRIRFSCHFMYVWVWKVIFVAIDIVPVTAMYAKVLLWHFWLEIL